SGIDPRGHRPPHQLRGREYDARRSRRRARRDGNAHAERPQARSDDVLQRHARGPRCDHRAVRFCQPDRCVDYRSRGWLVVEAVFFWERRGIDDPVGAISVHGINGLWGVISVGLFATGEYGAGWNGVVREEFVKLYGSDGVRGLFYGDASQLYMQLVNAAVVAAFGFAMAYAWFKVSDLITPIRVSKEVELEGLDGPEMGVLGYPDFQLHPSTTPGYAAVSPTAASAMAMAAVKKPVLD